MNTFHWPRFTRLLCNDFLQQWKKIWIATLAVMGLGCVIYLTNIDPLATDDPQLAVVLFVIALVPGGLLFTSTIFADMHDPLQRMQYLTLPCSNFERFLSRYLLSAPLYCLYVLVVYMVFDHLIAALARVLTGHSAPTFSLLEAPAWQLTLAYLAVHALMFTGAIYFRSYALIKTGLALTVLGASLMLVQFAAVLVFFWDSFSSVLRLETTRAINLSLAIREPSALTAIGVACWLWLLYMAYQCLCDHEVQDEL